MNYKLFTIFFFINSLLMISTSSNAFDSANDSTVDKADRFEFEDFHKDSAVTLWGKDKDKKEDSKTITTYEEPKKDEPTTTTEKATSVKEESLTPETVKPATKQNANAKTFDKGQELKVRSAYRLSVDPSLSAIPTLFEAVQDLHKQLNGYCPKGWKKEDEWHLPEQNYFYIHYRARCL